MNERMKRYRNKKRDVTVEDVTVEEPTSVTADVTQYPALLYALADPVKRAKLRRICEGLSNHNQLKNVYYGAGDMAVPFDMVNEYLAVLT